jgi:hypothetical protein
MRSLLPVVFALVASTRAYWLMGTGMTLSCPLGSLYLKIFCVNRKLYNDRANGSHRESWQNIWPRAFRYTALVPLVCSYNLLDDLFFFAQCSEVATSGSILTPKLFETASVPLSQSRRINQTTGSRYVALSFIELHRN